MGLWSATPVKDPTKGKAMRTPRLQKDGYKRGDVVAVVECGGHPRGFQNNPPLDPVWWLDRVEEVVRLGAAGRKYVSMVESGTKVFRPDDGGQQFDAQRRTHTLVITPNGDKTLLAKTCWHDYLAAGSPRFHSYEEAAEWVRRYTVVQE